MMSHSKKYDPNMGLPMLVPFGKVLGPNKSIAVTTAVSLFFSCSSLRSSEIDRATTAIGQIGLGPKLFGNQRMVV